MNRLTEPSTHAGIGGILLALAPFVPPQYQIFIQPIAAVFGALAVFLKERGAS